MYKSNNNDKMLQHKITNLHIHSFTSTHTRALYRYVAWHILLTSFIDSFLIVIQNRALILGSHWELNIVLTDYDWKWQVWGVVQICEQYFIFSLFSSIYFASSRLSHQLTHECMLLIREQRCSRGRHWIVQLHDDRQQINYGKTSVCQWFVRVVLCTDLTVWDRQLNLGVHHNGEWVDLNCNQKLT